MSNYTIQFINNNMKYSGIYIILNTKNSKMYIGSAVNIFKRYTAHVNLLKTNKHINKHLQNSWNNDKEYFRFILVEKVLDESLLLEKEQIWLDTLQSYNPEYGYNKAKIAGSTLGVKLSEKTRLKMSENRKGEKGSFYGKHHSEYSINLIREKISGEKSVWYGKKHSEDTIKILKEKANGTNNGFYGKHHSEESKEKISSSNINKKQTQDHVNKRFEKRKQPVIQYSLNHEIIKEWESISSVKQGGFSPMSVWNACNRTNNKYKNFLWEFKIKENTYNEIF